MIEPAPVVLFLCTGNYYRSRYAELLFDHLAQGLPHRADSAGLAPSCWERNPGPLSPITIATLAAHGVPVPSAPRSPRDVTEEDFRRAALVIAVNEPEHRAWMSRRFPAWIDHVRYWHVRDVQEETSSTALGQLHREVETLVAALRAGI
jgi:protein-tyrosine phosphatase